MWHLASASFVVLLAAVSQVCGADHKHPCNKFIIPLEITAPQYDLNIDIETNWDVEAYIFNATRRDTLQAFHPIGGNRTATRMYNISSTFCTPGSAGKAAGTLLFLTHGTLVDGRYWSPDFRHSERYSFVQHALDHGYSVFFYDRLGTGESDLPDPFVGSQFPAQLQILVSLTKALRQPETPYTCGIGISKVVHVGHSFGSYLTIAALTSEDTASLTDAIILTGYTGQFQWLSLFTAGGQARVAALSNPKKWADRSHGYLVPVDLYALVYGGFKVPYFDHAAAEWLHDVQSPFAIGEQLTTATVIPDLSRVTVPIQVVQGRYDITQCGGDCDGVLNVTKALFVNSPLVVVNDSFKTGHFLNYHYDAPRAFDAMTSFVQHAIEP